MVNSVYYTAILYVSLRRLFCTKCTSLIWDMWRYMQYIPGLYHRSSITGTGETAAVGVVVKRPAGYVESETALVLGLELMGESGVIYLQCRLQYR